MAGLDAVLRVLLQPLPSTLYGNGSFLLNYTFDEPTWTVFAGFDISGFTDYTLAFAVIFLREMTAAHPWSMVPEYAALPNRSSFEVPRNILAPFMMVCEYTNPSVMDAILDILKGLTTTYWPPADGWDNPIPNMKKLKIDPIPWNNLIADEPISTEGRKKSRGEKRRLLVDGRIVEIDDDYDELGTTEEKLEHARELLASGTATALDKRSMIVLVRCILTALIRFIERSRSPANSVQ